MKILLTRPHFRYYPYEPPLGIAALAAYLEERGLDVSIIDFEALPQMSDEELADRIKTEDPDIVGISFFTYDRFEAVKLAKAAKKSGKTVIGGGVHITFDAIGTLQSVPDVDIGVLGEGEDTLHELITALEENRSMDDILGIAFRQDRNIRVNQLRPLIIDLDALPMPAYHLLPMEKYPYHQILGSRGCPYNCVFCSSPNFWRRKTRFRSFKAVADEIEHLVTKYGDKEFDFKDDNLFFKKEWTEKLCNELLARNIRIEWNCLGRVNQVDEKLFRLMRKAGCKAIRFGVESGNERILKVINKKITKQQVKHAVKTVKNIPFKVGTLFMLGHPTETQADMEDTCNFAIDLDADHYSFKPADIYPGTRLFAIAVEEGLLPENFSWFEKGKYIGGKYTYDDIPSYESRNFSRETLENTATRFYLRSFISRLFTLQSVSDIRISRFRTGSGGLIPHSKTHLRILINELSREIFKRRTWKQRFLGMTALAVYLIQRFQRMIILYFKRIKEN